MLLRSLGGENEAQRGEVTGPGHPLPGQALPARWVASLFPLLVRLPMQGWQIH